MREETIGVDAVSDPRHWRLVGRSDELSLAVRTLAGGRSVVLTGAAGVGKTRLAREVLERTARDSDVRFWVAATEATAQIPFGAVAHLLVRDPSDEDRASTLQRVTAALADRAGGGRVLLGVDDAHLLDEASSALVHLAVSSGVARAVVTYRSGAALPSAITALWKDGDAPLISLQPFARAECDELIASALGGPVDRGTLSMLSDASAGNALFLRELVQLGLDSNGLRRDADMWRWTGPLLPGERLAQIVARHIGGLIEPEQRALELIALGEPLTAASVRALGIEEATDRLLRRGVATMNDGYGGEVRLAHPLFGEVVRARIPALTLDTMRSQLAHAVASCAVEGDDHDRFRVALWRAQCGDISHPDELRWAARHSLSLWDGVIAEQFARAALASEPGLETAYLLAESLRYQNRAAEAVDVYASAETLSGPQMLQAAVAAGWAHTVGYQLGRRDEARAVLLRALDRLEDPAARRRVAGALLDEGLASPDEIAAHVVDDPGAPAGAFGAAVDALLKGRFDVLFRRVDLALEHEATWGAEFTTLSVLLRVVRVVGLVLSGRATEAASRAQASYEETSTAEYPRGAWCFVRGLVATVRGLPETAIEALGEADGALRAADAGLLMPTHAYLAMACAATASGIPAAVEALEAAQRDAQTLGRLFSPEVRRAAGWIAAAQGDLRAARERCGAAADEARALGSPVLEALALHDVARFGGAASVVERLDGVVSEIEGGLFDAIANRVRALVGEDADRLVRAAESFEALGYPLFCAEALADAARHYDRVGRNGAAGSCRLRARVVVQACADVTSPALKITSAASELTAREYEVALLAAAGRSSRAIADSLGITVRTVDNLLGRAYAKLGIAGRGGLVDVLREARTGGASES